MNIFEGFGPLFDSAFFRDHIISRRGTLEAERVFGLGSARGNAFNDHIRSGAYSIGDLLVRFGIRGPGRIVLGEKNKALAVNLDDGIAAGLVAVAGDK